jgi:hypothetical protein
MPSRSYQWGTLDVVASEAIDKMINAAGLSNREIDRITSGGLSYGRVRDLRKQTKAPVRLSEFFAIADLCKKDPIAELKAIRYESLRREAKNAAEADSKPSLAGERFVDDEQARVAETLQKLKRGDMDIVALEDEHKYDGDGDDPA